MTAGSQGESRLRMLRIVRRGDRHDPRDLSVSLRFEGAFEGAYTAGTPEGLVPGEAIKTLVHAAARAHGHREVEELGLVIASQLVQRQPRIARVRVELSEQRWQRLEAGGRAQPQAFVGGSSEHRIAIVTTNGPQTSVVGGIGGLTLLRTAGFTSRTLRDGEEVAEGIQPLLVGSLAARWTYTTGDVTFNVYRQGLRAAVLDTFAWHESRSVQHALHAVAQVLLSTYDEIADVTVRFEERPYRPADLFSAGTENPDELFVVIDEPLGLVEVTVERAK